MPADKAGEEISPALVQLIENNLLLKTAIADIKTIKATQEMNHVIAIELRDHNTIERVDQLRLTISNARRVLVGIGAVLAALWATHTIWNWP